MSNEELVALIERRFSQLEEILLAPEEEIDRVDRGVGPTDERLRRIASRIHDLEKRLDDVRPMPITRIALINLEHRIANVERTHAALEARVLAIETSR